MAARRIQPIIFPAKSTHTATVIFAHGLGDTGHGWAPAVQEWREKRKMDEIKFILPTAPTIPITANGGYAMPGWFDIKVLGSIETMRASEDRTGILASSTYLSTLIDSEVSSGIPAERIMLGGFSQGGAMAMFAGLTSKVKLGGIVAMSSWLVLSSSFKEFLPKEVAGGLGMNGNTPLLMCQGDEDPLVRPEMSVLSYSVLNAMGFNVERKVYEGLAHSASEEELDDVEEFIATRLPPNGSAANSVEGKSEL